MKIQKYIKLLAILVILLALGCTFEVHIQTDLKNAILTSRITPDHKQENIFSEPKRFLQSVSLASGTGVTLSTISNTKFPGLTIYHDIPLNWIIGQVFQVRGRLNAAAASNGTYVSFSFINTANQASRFWFYTIVPAGLTDFALNVDTRTITVGDYYLALYPDLAGSYTNANVYQIRYPSSQSYSVSAPFAPTECSLSFEENKLVLRWNEDRTTPLEKITFTQGNQNVEYILSNFQSSFIIPHRDFVNFLPGYVTVRISSAHSSQLGFSGQLSQFSLNPWITSFKAGYHGFADFAPGITLGTQIPWIVSIGTTIRIQGWTSSNINNQMFIEQPQYVVSVLNLTNSQNQVLPPNTYFDKMVTLFKEGVYIIEINADSGQAVLNRPVYVGDALPLLPDQLDLKVQTTNESQIIAQQPQDIGALRSTLFALINQKRLQWGRSPLSMDNDLTIVAQNHSNDMMNRNYFGHMNPDGEWVWDRAAKAGIYEEVGENLALNMDLNQAHFTLVRSPGHLSNIVDPGFTRVGLGIARNSQGQLLVTQNFAYSQQSGSITGTPDYSNPIQPSSQTQTTTQTTSSSITPSQIQSIRLQVRDWIALSYPSSHQDPVLSNIVTTWLNTNTGLSIFDYTWDTSNYQTQGLSASSVTGPYSTSITSYFVIGSHLSQPDPTYVKFGVGVLLQADNSLKVQVEYAQ